MPTIEDAIRTLKEDDWRRLRQVGQFLARKTNSDSESLLLEALERTLSGKRRWNKEAVDFVGHLIGVMRSVASHQAKRRGRTVALTSSIELIDRDTPEHEVSAQEQIRKLRSHFHEREDTEALEVLDAMEIGCDGPMIRSELGLTQTQLETIIRRIRRAAHRVLPA